MKGFTLIELLVVIGIIAILALVAVPNFLEAQTRSKVSRAKADIRTLATGMEAYAVDQNGYPPNYNTGMYPGITAVTEYLTFAALTTPVQYLTSTPMDVFGPGPDYPERERYFDYVAFDTVSGQAGSYPPGCTAYWEANGIKWFISSRGPDRLINGLGIRLQEGVTYVYDPTNGTISAGDFGRGNREQVP